MIVIVFREHEAEHGIEIFFKISATNNSAVVTLSIVHEAVPSKTNPTI